MVDCGLELIYWQYITNKNSVRYAMKHTDDLFSISTVTSNFIYNFYPLRLSNTDNQERLFIKINAHKTQAFLCIKKENIR